ncbi:MAG: NAD(P)-dependent oxidoreductase [Chloroflexota bacterium]
MTEPSSATAPSGIAGGRPRVVFFDPIPAPWAYDLERSVLEPAGVELVIPEDAAAAERLIVDADVVIATSVARLDGERIARLRDPAGILCYSIGMNQVDHAAAEARGIPVTNVPGYCSDEVADHALTLLLALWRHLVPIVDLVEEHGWKAIRRSRHVEGIRRVRGKTLGIVGAGRIGTRVAARAQGFGLRTIAADPFVASRPGLPVVPLAELLATADAVVLCAALTPQSRHLIDAASLRHAKPGMLFVNVARGGLVDEPALAAALADGRIAFAALDVRDPEPPDPEHDPFRDLPNVVETPHVAASSQEAVVDLHLQAAEICLDLLRAAGRLPA